MARETRITLIDDIDGTDATESINFTINTNSYEIDLNDANAAAFRAAFQPYVDSAQHNTKQTTTDSPAIREWAAQNNIQVNARGRIKQDIIDQYHNSLRKQAAGRK
ncbi:hypothetical protein AOZ07_01430 [Glutamicibacter halophytocola]|uniref:histone-like nucleoid-structuring protein Lsr2 n=1 Tax=Glutamicibacter halophytocola TaxID=1933880 RepID=UPI0006D4B64B|nr:Lsr2 family protein [Glutamicibacter halophytocola]ALG27790.1 hypothetical protein AOZ07_01430 [Glutamicibacter halophytocola]